MVENKCNNCVNLQNYNCTLNREKLMIYDDNCDSYAPKEMGIIEPKSNENKTVKEKKSDKITDWLMLFLVMVGLGSVFSAIYPIVTFEFQKYAYFYSLAFTDIMIGIGSLLLGIYVIVSFNKRRQNAVFLAKSYIGLVLLYNLIFLALDQYEVNGFFNMGQRIRGVAWGIIWGAYFYYSKQVESLFPKCSRRIYTRDKLMLSTFIIIPLLMAFVVQPIEYDHKYANLPIKTINIENRFSIDIPENLHQRNDLGEGLSLQYGDLVEELIVKVLEEPHEQVERQLKNSLYEDIELSISDYYEIVRNQKDYINKKDTLIQWLPTIIETTKIEDLYYVGAYIKGEYGFYQIISVTTLEKADKLKDKMYKIIVSFKEL